jgi:hypothetical protein
MEILVAQLDRACNALRRASKTIAPRLRCPPFCQELLATELLDSPHPGIQANIPI